LKDKRNVEFSELLLTKPKLRTYRNCKNSISCENYVFIRNRKKRSFVAQIRLGILPLNIELGRFRGVKLEERTCEICKNNLIEDEFHFLCVCPLYESYRNILYN
jgi:hypothetical protein